MQEPAVTKKGKTVESISISVLQLEVSKGHLKWKVTDLEAKARISRSLVYRYLGSTKEEILRSALQIFTASFFGFSEEGLNVPFAERVRKTRAFLIENPEAIIIYQKCRSKDTWDSQELIAAEAKFQRKLKNLYPKLTDFHVLMIHGFLHGLVTGPFLSGEQAFSCAEKLEDIIRCSQNQTEYV